jgi:hypothetical protein
MTQVITNIKKFVSWLNDILPGVYRQITVQDAQLLTKLGLIGRYGYYGHQDLETIRGLLRYEELREKRILKEEAQATIDVPRCTRCHQPLPPHPQDRRGRPIAYCATCQPYRNKERHRNWRRRKRAVMKAGR